MRQDDSWTDGKILALADLDGSYSSQACARRVLMLAYAFPPTGGSGVQRSVKFAKYLPQFGWLPAVWTTDRIVDLPEDPTLLEDLPAEVCIHRWRGNGRVESLHRRLRGRVAPGKCGSKLLKALEWRLEGWLARNSLPDRYSSWARTSVKPLLGLVEREGIDAIYSTYSPASNHLLALMLREETRLPWVADFRDLWTDDPRYVEPSPGRRAAHRRLEQRILETADAVVGVSPRQTEVLAERVPHARHKFLTVTNGFDPDDFAGAYGERRAGDAFVLSFVGRFDRYRANTHLLSGMRLFLAGLGSERNTFLFRIVGHANADTLETLRRLGIPHAFRDYVPHRQAIGEMCSADALLASLKPLGPHTESIINGKIFEYLASGRPILVVSPEGGECGRIVGACGAGICARADEESVAAALREMYRAWRAGRPLTGCDPERLRPYSRRGLTGRLAQVLDRLTGKGSAEPAAPELQEAGTT